MTVALEVSPSSEWCQRWGARAHTWRHRSDGGFNADDYYVAAVDEATAKAYVVKNHYSGSYPAARLRYGMFRQVDDRLVGVLVLSVPAQAKVVSSVFPDLEPFAEALDLGRLVIADECASNSETWFMGQAFREAADVGVRGVVSFADPCPRVVDGRLLFPGHRGLIYAAKGATYTGRATARTLLILPDGTVLNARSMQKVRRQERGHRHVEEKLVRLGAPTIRACENPTAWLANAVDVLNVTRLRHRGNHRFAFALGGKAERRRVRIAPTPVPHPKEIDR